MWQSIDTAPRVAIGASPVEVLLYGPSIGVKTGTAAVYPCSPADYVFAGVSYIAGNIAFTNATHWMPLPEAPDA